MSRIDRMLEDARRYMATVDLSGVAELAGRRFEVAPLAQGEYNLNYRLTDGNRRFVLRINIGTQIERSDQIRYEYRALELLASSTVTPRPLFLDDSGRLLDNGVLIMTYLPGGPLDYRRDLPAAAGLLAAVHQVPVAAIDNHLIREDRPLTLIYEECARLLETYFASELADTNIRAYLREVMDWARQATVGERYYRQDPADCIVNTEVNSGNFIVDRPGRRIYLVDWEMPRWGDPSQDIAHFCSPLTTLWKTDYRMSAADRRGFVAAYGNGLRDRHLRDTLAERIRLREPFVLLRGISWSAMGWVAYQTAFDGVRNPSTWATLQRYLDLKFIRSLFDPVMRRPTA